MRCFIHKPRGRSEHPFIFPAYIYIYSTPSPQQDPHFTELTGAGTEPCFLTSSCRTEAVTRCHTSGTVDDHPQEAQGRRTPPITCAALNVLFVVKASSALVRPLRLKCHEKQNKSPPLQETFREGFVFLVLPRSRDPCSVCRPLVSGVIGGYCRPGSPSEERPPLPSSGHSDDLRVPR